MAEVFFVSSSLFIIGEKFSSGLYIEKRVIELVTGEVHVVSCLTGVIDSPLKDFVIVSVDWILTSPPNHHHETSHREKGICYLD